MGTQLHVSRDLDLELEQIIGHCIAVLGIRGSGKSNTAGVIFEELLEHNYPMSIVDIEGEYFGLKEQHEVLVVGTGEGVEIDIDAHCAPEIAQISMEQNVPIVLDLSGFLSDERTALLSEYLSSLWDLAGRLRRPYIIGIEEAHEFIPQGVKTELKEKIARIALRGRKRGLGAIIVSQRSAKVDKDVLSQAGMLFLHRVVHEVDMRVYGELLPWRKSEVKEIVSSLETGECIYVNGDSVRPIGVRERTTFHAGFTPSLETVVTPELKRVSASIIEAIEQARSGKQRKTRAEELQERISRLEAQLADKDRTIAELEEAARILGYIRVDVPMPLPHKEAVAVAPVKSVEASRERPRTAKQAVLTHRGSARQGEIQRGQSPEPLNTVIDVVGRPARQEAKLPPAVMRHIDRLVARIAKTNLLHRRLLAFLVDHAPGAYSVDQIAAWTDCAKELIEDEPPRDFLDSGLIDRERTTNGLLYRSSLNSFVSKEFCVYQPDIGSTGLHVVTQLLRSRLAGVAAS
jgi:hypothetical protein